MESKQKEHLDEVRKLFKSKSCGSEANGAVDFSEFDEKIDKLDRDTLMELFNASQFLFPDFKL